MTKDNGKEFAQHQVIEESLEIEYFFASPYHRQKRSVNKNFNGFLKQYFYKKHDFNLIAMGNFQSIEDKFNNRPRKRFGFLAPNLVYLQALNNKGYVEFIT